jgi:Tfp pilus assembly protein PilV|tara:strand:+ start:4001 stop:4630 length:630 start_codon:yes stop_codon:yes gene_type:complete
MLENINGVVVTGLDNIKRKANEKGITILEALVSTAIIGIGFVAVFQMVQYAVRSIDVSGERTKMNYLVSMVAEDIISDKNSKDASKKDFLQNLIDNKNSTKQSWVMDTCKDKPSTKTNHANAYQNKTQKWEFRFAKDRVKCNSTSSAGATKDTKALKIFDICNNKVSGANCSYPNVDAKSALYEKLYIGKMEAKMNSGNKTRYLYFPIK